MNIGEASAVTTLVQHFTDGAQPDDCADEVVLAVVDLNARARKALSAGAVLPTLWLTRRDEILAERRAQQRRSTTPRRPT
ncbi:hypothetical protein GA707_18540 [Nostocoides sp. F2B08]|uniref:hypothetical protein n=1 Tax=Nostocoides sp. F2B08 TaxID=2653936 RepID=UPI001263DF87|nr:hypothetical protein [Tetrasphaera sp. F2B08]KAB7740899.1 hypothetical protein GA707_18540 [Tetrasphaera sp. F2B08]